MPCSRSLKFSDDHSTEANITFLGYYSWVIQTMPPGPLSDMEKEMIPGVIGCFCDLLAPEC